MAGLVFYVTFSFYWTTQVVANIVLCTLAGGIFGGELGYAGAGLTLQDGTTTALV